MDGADAWRGSECRLSNSMEELHMAYTTLTNRLSLLVFASLVGAMIHAPVYAGPQPTGPGPAWAKLAPVPTDGTGVEGMSVANVGDTIIAALGLDSVDGDTVTTRLYSIAHDTWSLGADAPGPSSEGAGVAHGGLFYNVGGRIGGPGSAARSDIWSYDLEADAWDATLTPMPTARAGLAIAVVGDSIYAIGGRSATAGPCRFIRGAPLALVERYDISSDTWTAVAPLLAPRSDLAAAVVGGKIYVFGGCDAAGAILADVDVYDPRTDTWSAAPADMPTARAGMYAVTTKGDTVYVIGGWDGIGNGLSTNEAYKVSKNTWTAGLLAMPTPRAEAGAAATGGRIYIVGGSQPAFGASVNANEAFKP